jgi:uncharacterized membrane protein
MANAANPAAPSTGQAPDSLIPSLVGIFPRVIMITFGITGISFAVSLFVGILCMVMMGAFRGHLPDMRLAYRMFALPIAAMVGIVVLVVASTVEVRHYFRAKRLNQKNLELGR